MYRENVKVPIFVLTNYILHEQATKTESCSRENEDLQTEDKGRTYAENPKK